MKLLQHYSLLALLAIITLTSCTENLFEDNRPGLQAVRNGEFFKATDFSTSLNNDGSLTIVGQNSVEFLRFDLEASAVGTYRLGSGEGNEAQYTMNEGVTFSTNMGSGRGEVQITDIDDAKISGNFSFVSYLPNNADSLYMRQGVIYDIPIGSDIIDPIGGGGAGVSEFSVNIDGTPFNPTQTSTALSSGTLVITAINGPNGVSIILPSNSTPGTYNFSASGDFIGSYGATSSAPSISTSGTLVITAADQAARTISADFEFETGPPNNFQLTEGSFTVSY